MNRELGRVLGEVQKVIVGKQDVIEKILMAMLAEGHILLDDVPGVGKTSLALALSRAMGLVCHRVQFTPDVLPSDIVGFSVYDRESGEMVYRPGVICHTNLLLGDEINRTSSKTQSALLEAMEEGQVTVDGCTHPLETPFIVIATQNHVGTAGTQLLPYAQLDRFMVRLQLGYPDYEAQMQLLRDRQTENPVTQVEEVGTDLVRMQSEVREVTVSQAILSYITRLSVASRESARLELGISPRGALFLMRMAKASAYLEGRDFVLPRDVQRLFVDVCAHRVIVARQARASSEADVLREILGATEVPDLRG